MLLNDARARTSNADQTRAPGYCRQPKEGSFENMHPTSESPCSDRRELAYSRQYILSIHALPPLPQEKYSTTTAGPAPRLHLICSLATCGPWNTATAEG